MTEVNANGAAIPTIGLGTYTLRGKTAVNLVAAGLDAGYRHIDTARMYNNETEVGEGLRASGVPRSEVFVTTKVWSSDIGAGDLPHAAEASLRRLQLDQVDLLLIHWPNPGIPLRESIEALNAVRRAGRARHIGVSNFSPALLTQAVSFSEAPLVCNQVEYHPLIDQADVLSACRAAGMALVAHTPLHRGRGLFEEQAVRRASERLNRTPAQIVLRWHVQQEGVIAIPRTSRKESLAENLAVFDFNLSASEMQEIGALAAGRRRA